MTKIKRIITIVALVAATAIIGCTSTKVTETPPGSGNFVTNHIVDPNLTAGLETAKAINDATKPVNPFAGVVEIGLGTIAALAAWFAKRKNDQATQSTLLLRTVVQGVEQADDTKVKETIEKHATKMGVQGPLGTAVAKITSQ